MKNYMQFALQLAKKGQYTASPNPLVGCVIEKNGHIIGCGWHKAPGSPHAEIEALKKAGSLAKNSNVYVNLEPCFHFGKTPPCVDALIAAQVNSVHIPFIDPNPLVNGQSVKKLQNAGIKVYLGEEAEKARQLNEVFLYYMTHKAPFIIAKWATTLDGKIATRTGDSKWITSIKARTDSHKLRCKVDAILVGANTVIQDDPRLTPHLINSPKVIQQPLRIVLDARGKIPEQRNIFQSSPENTLIITTKYSSKQWQNKIKSTGAEIWIIETNQKGEIDLNCLLKRLGKIEMSSLLVEGGSKTLTSFFKLKLINKIYTYIAPKIIGDIEACPPVFGFDIFQISQALNLDVQQTKRLGDDLLMVSYPRWEG